MKLRRPNLIAAVVAAAFIAGCASTSGVLPKGDDVYTINVHRGDAGKVKLRAYQHAQKYCGTMGKTMQVVKENLRADPNSANQNYSVIDLDFRCTR